MGIANKPTQLSIAHLDHMIALAHFVAKFFRLIADFADIFGESLLELKRIRVSIKGGRLAGSINEFLDRLSNDELDSTIRDVLERSKVVKFEMGRLWVQSTNSFDMNHLRLLKDVIRNRLKTQYGTEFNVRIAGA